MFSNGIVKLRLVGLVMNHSIKTPVSTAAIIVIGDEILKGQTMDTNSHYLCKGLYKMGIRVDHIRVIHDNVDTIANQVRECSDKYTHVITSGGIGPTHDDMTMLGVAQAFNEPLKINRTLEHLIEDWFKEDVRRENAMKMASLPSSAKLVWGDASLKFPLITVKNVFILPGIPSLMQNGFKLLQDCINSTHEFHSHQLYLTCDEVSIAPILTRIASQFSDSVNIGSYPKLMHSYYNVKLTIDSTDEMKSEQCWQTLKNELKAHVINFDWKPMENAVKKFDRFLQNLISSEMESDRKFGQVIKESVEVIEKVLQDYEPNQICIAFNGGKDCTALLHLVYVTAARLGKVASCSQAIYFKPSVPFEETEHFINDTKRRYSLSVTAINGAVKIGLERLKIDRPELFVVFLGSRNCDHKAQPEFVCPTDSDWPSYLRAAPILSWSYSDIWKFLRGLYLPYCSLYDAGYTSMGCKDRTEKNEALKYTNSRGALCYKPAYLLKDESLERKGRM